MLNGRLNWIEDIGRVVLRNYGLVSGAVKLGEGFVCLQRSSLLDTVKGARHRSLDIGEKVSYDPS